ncbi:unnamed protein product [Acanthoscelides obtectus]|uniref:CCHC-type domain-containing protein n=1 Tax=Acanthoscelides obtectus TaxID=200917 RepID=A0A9P0KF20_ACAOB|nr:unnamed protein product [Acanthoscelides obtectus]CAK1642566.1 hypothetical protein AOBTE_LOCUS13118 [Acanthoscelides obtectus]
MNADNPEAGADVATITKNSRKMVGNEENEDSCTKCKEDIKEDYYTCDVCNGKIHQVCAQLSSSEVRCMPLQKRTLLYACVNCKDVLKKIPNLVIFMEDIKKQLADKSTTTPVPIPIQQSQYSDVLKKRCEEVIVIKPKDKTQDSSKTKKVVEEKINPAEIGVGVSRVKYVKEGGIAISCTKKEDITNISENIKEKLDKEYEINIPKKKNPKIKVISIQQKYIETPDTLIETIIKQNGISTAEDERVLKIISAYEHKSKKYGIIILEVDQTIFDVINKKEVLYIGWKKCKYFEHVNVIQCYKCWKFGHMAQQCTNANVVCPKCSGNHKQEECTSDVNVCVNCKYALDVLKLQVRYDHTAYNRNCEGYKRIFEQLQMRVAYPQLHVNKQSK